MNVNQLACATGGGNTGVGTCFADPKNIVGAILTPVGYTITDAQIAAGLLTKLEQDIIADKSSRIYPVFGFVGITDNSEDATTETYGYGGLDYVREGFNNWLLRFVKGGICLNAQMRKFNNMSLGALFVDATGLIWGEKVATGVKAIDMEKVFTPNWKVNTGAATTIYNTRFVFDAVAMNDSPGFITTSDLGFNVKSLMGLQNVAIVKVTRAAGVLTVRALAGCASTNLYDDYSTELANAALWVARNAATGNQIAITSVTADPNTSGFIVTLNTTDTDYTTGAVALSLASPTVLDTAGVSGYESVPALITI